MSCQLKKKKKRDELRLISILYTSFLIPLLCQNMWWSNTTNIYKSYTLFCLFSHFNWILLTWMGTSFTEVQNDRCWNLQRSSCPAPHSNSHLKLVAHMAFEYLQGWRLQSLSGQSILMLSHSHVQTKSPVSWASACANYFLQSRMCLTVTEHLPSC